MDMLIAFLSKLDLGLEWRYKGAYGDPSRIHYGPMAEEVCKVLPRICSRDAHGKVISYDWPSLLFALAVEDQRQIDGLKKEIAGLKAKAR